MCRRLSDSRLASLRAHQPLNLGGHGVAVGGLGKEAVEARLAAHVAHLLPYLRHGARGHTPRLFSGENSSLSAALKPDYFVDYL